MNYQTIKKEVQELARRLSGDAAKLSPDTLKSLTKDYHHKKMMLDLYDEEKKLTKEIVSLQSLMKSDTELKSDAEQEIETLQKRRDEISDKLKNYSKPVDPSDKKNVIMEIRAGAGGDEAALFAADLFRMYSKFALEHDWQTKLISTNRTGLAGFKEVIFSIAGNGAYGKLKYESGVHRVQRIPETEKSGRVHTSTATVAVLPEAEEVDIDIKPEDLRIDTFTSSGHGGQSVNTTYSAVRITHLPTNTVVSCQDERSQQQNKTRALTVLRSRLLALEMSKQHAERSEDRRSQVGTGDRSEKIRTYNFPQDRLTDHRLKKNWHNIQSILDGKLEPIIKTLHEYNNK